MSSWAKVGSERELATNIWNDGKCGKSARCVRRGGGWKRGTVEIV